MMYYVGFALPTSVTTSVTAPLHLRCASVTVFSSVTACAAAPLQLRYRRIAPLLHLHYSFVTASIAAPLQLRCTSVTAPFTASGTAQICSSVAGPLQLRYTHVASSATAPLQLPLQHCYIPLQQVVRCSLPLRLRYSSVTNPVKVSVISTGTRPRACLS